MADFTFDARHITPDGFVPVYDSSGKLIMRYHPLKKQVEIQRRKKKVIIDLLEIDTADTLYRISDPSRTHIDLIRNTPQSATSAANTGGAHGRLTY